MMNELLQPERIRSGGVLCEISADSYHSPKVDVDEVNPTYDSS